MTVTICNIDAWEYIKTIPDNSIDMILTDPMYGYQINLLEFMRICKGNIITFCDPKFRYFKPDEILHWIKPISTKNTIKKMSNFVEEILVLRRGNTYNHNMQWANYCGIFFDIVEGEIVHPYQKPLALIERIMRIYSNPGDLIFDPFLGSGTTIKAANNLKRNVIGCETNIQYYEAMSVLTQEIGICN